MRSAILFLEPSPELAPAVCAELSLRVRQVRIQGECRTTGTGAVQRLEIPECLSVNGMQLTEFLKSDCPLGIVLDLISLPRESLTTLRQLQSLSAKPYVMAVGDSEAVTLISVLLEAGCSQLVTERPFDLQIADWCERVLSRMQDLSSKQDRLPK